MDFKLSDDIEDYRRRVRTFVETHILLLEDDRANFDPVEDNIRPDVLQRVRQEVKKAGLWALQMPLEFVAGSR